VRKLGENVMLKKIGLTFLGLLALTAVSYAGGAFQGYPLVGGNGTSNCLSFGNNGVCNQYQPAGPSDVPPGSTFPADTNIQGGGSNANPSTVNIPAVLTGAVVWNASPLTGTSTTLPAGVSKVVLTPAGTIAAYTLTLPAGSALVDGQELFFYTNNTVTSFTVTAGSGTTITPSITTLTAAAPVKLIYVQLTATTGTWQAF